MTTYFPFVASNKAPPSFQTTLDGAAYTCYVVWNLFAQRYYLNCYDSNNNLIFTVALVQTSASLPIQTVTWSVTTNSVTVTMVNPHNYPIASTVELAIQGCNPTAYNGTYKCLITGPSTFTYSLSTNPGTMASAGSVSYLINLCQGYFFTNTIIYRNSQFEVGP